MTGPDASDDLAAAPRPGDPLPQRNGALWRVLFFGSIVALLVVVSFGVGMLSERMLFAGGGLLERTGVIGGLTTDFDPAASAFPRYAETKALLQDEYLFRPTDSDAAATFSAELDQGAMAGVAAVAATPEATLDDYRRELDYGAAQGMTAALDDPYTIFLEPVEQEPLAEQLEGEYEGIGVWVEHPEGEYRIVAPIPGSPADEAGIQPGDVLIAADGTPLTGLPDDRALALIRGPAGTTVRLTIRREGRPDDFDLEVERRAIAMPSVVYEPQADGRVAWISIGIFGDKTTEQLDRALSEAKADGVQGIVLDLRGNGGGWVTSAREMVGRFVPQNRGPALYEDSGAAGEDRLEAESIVGGGQQVFDLPMAVLIDGGSASASEIVAGALRDYDRAVLVGQPSFGKGLVQRVHDFDDGSSARITFARWLTPDKEPIPADGIRPDIAVAPPQNPDEGDVQLLAAVNEVLRAAGESELTPAAPGAATPAANLATPQATPVD
ncbi:MAG: S41 family peptidase [Thermomicrobiales bacterium]|nr:S41 family peptidase [Thermomicrobiales bacterium]